MFIVKNNSLKACFHTALYIGLLALSACEMGGTTNTQMKVMVAAKKAAESAANTPPGDPVDLKTPVARTPIDVCTVDQLLDIKNSLDGSFRLTCDINLNARSTWDPIGTAQAPFTGIFDGNGKKIYNLTVSESDREADLSIFGVNAGLIENLKLNNITFETPSQLAVVANLNTANGVIKNVLVSNGLLAGGFIVGGLVGENDGAISDSLYDGEIVPLMRPTPMGVTDQPSLLGNIKQTLVGGIAGRSQGTNSKVTGSLGQMRIEIDTVKANRGAAIFNQIVALGNTGVTYPVADADKVAICFNGYDAASVANIKPDPRTIAPSDDICSAAPLTPDDPVDAALLRENKDVLRGGIAADNPGVIINCNSRGMIGYLVNH